MENSLGFCNLFSLCVCTLHTSFHGRYRKTLWSNFLVTDIFLLLYFFFLIGNPSLPQKLNDFLLLGKIFKLPSCSNQFSSNLINTSSCALFAFPSPLPTRLLPFCWELHLLFLSCYGNKLETGASRLLSNSSSMFCNRAYIRFV